MCNISQPCYRCMDRTAECHITCEKYIKWSKERARQTELEHLEKGISCTVSRLSYNSRVKTLKRKGDINNG